MSIRRMIFYTGMLAAIFLIIGCEGDEGPTGPEGTAVCGDCHSDDTQIVAISAQWDISVHATGGNFTRNSSPCSRCHTSEGFVSYLDTGEGGEPENPSAIGCFTCHMPHTNHDFSLRTTDPVELMLGGTFDLGDGNLCVNCHQARTPDPEVPASGTVEITSGYWGPHYSSQGNVLSGNGAYVFSGASYRSSGHSNAVTNGCPTCHMAPPYGAQAGGHTWNIAYMYRGGETDLVSGCVTCHPPIEDFSYGNVQADTEVLLDSLAQLLMAANLLDDSDHVIPGTLTADEAGAVYNYIFMLKDHSQGIHNPAYVEDVLEASIAAVSP